MRATDFINEDMSRRGFLGALGGAAMAAAGVDAEAKPKVIKPKTKSPSQDVIQQAKKQQTTKQASPTKDPQAEAMLYRTAKASGMKGSELAQFLAQTKHESWDHSRLQENMIPIKKGVILYCLKIMMSSEYGLNYFWFSPLENLSLNSGVG